MKHSSRFQYYWFSIRLALAIPRQWIIPTNATTWWLLSRRWVHSTLTAFRMVCRHWLLLAAILAWVWAYGCGGAHAYITWATAGPMTPLKAFTVCFLPAIALGLAMVYNNRRSS